MCELQLTAATYSGVWDAPGHLICRDARFFITV